MKFALTREDTSVTATTEREPVLTATNLKVRYGAEPWGPKVLDKVSFDLMPGEITCVIGPNGAGKTTLMNLLAGCLFKRRNKIKVCGLDRWRNNMAIRRRTTYVPATHQYSMGLTPYQHFMAIGRLYYMDPETYAARCEALVSDLEFEEYLDYPWPELSLGLTHKAMMIGGFLPDADLRILDEPVASGIDPLGMEILGVWMKEARARGEAILFSTQVLDRAHLLADKLLILGEGKTVFWGRPAELMQQMQVDPTDEYALNAAFLRLFQQKGID